MISLQLRTPSRRRREDQRVLGQPPARRHAADLGVELAGLCQVELPAVARERQHPVQRRLAVDVANAGLARDRRGEVDPAARRAGQEADRGIREALGDVLEHLDARDQIVPRTGHKLGDVRRTDLVTQRGGRELARGGRALDAGNVFAALEHRPEEQALAAADVEVAGERQRLAQRGGELAVVVLVDPPARVVAALEHTTLRRGGKQAAKAHGGTIVAIGSPC